MQTKITITSFLLILTHLLMAQVPEGINFQGVARDANNTPLENTVLSIELDLHSDGVTGYLETHQTTTDANGVYSIVIGEGMATVGVFNQIDWSVISDMSVTIDIGDDNTTDIEFTTAFQAVPYALHAKEVTNKDDADADPQNELQTITYDNGVITLSDGGKITLPADQVNDADADPRNELQTIKYENGIISLSDGGSITLPADQVNDADADPNNELQTLNYNDGVIFLSRGGSITLPADQVNDADADPNNELQTISYENGVISLSNGGNITLPADQVNDADADPANELQQLNLTENNLSITNGNSLDLSKYTVIFGSTPSDVPSNPQNGQLYYDEICKALYLWNGAGWSEIQANPSIANIYDKDGDGILNSEDNCIEVANPDQADDDNDGIGNACDNNTVVDKDGDGVVDGQDNCAEVSNPDQADLDNDGIGNTCDADKDGDGILDSQDNCIEVSNPDQADADNDGIGNTCDDDMDGDGILNTNDNCPMDANPDQADADGDGEGDVCDESTIVDCEHPAFNEFNSDAVTVSFDGNEVTIESNGLPNHTSPYWPTDNALYIEPVVAVAQTPGRIRGRSYTLTVSLTPELAANSTTTGLGPIGISVTGVPIFNDSEGQNRPLEATIAETFDYAGAHNGPSGYHYHAESKGVPENTVLSHDDEKLVGIMMDGFFLYGRKEMDGSYPTDLDESGGHFGVTPHSCGKEVYHYHIINEFFFGDLVVLFGGDLRGTPSGIF